MRKVLIIERRDSQAALYKDHYERGNSKRPPDEKVATTRVQGPEDALALLNQANFGGFAEVVFYSQIQRPQDVLPQLLAPKGRITPGPPKTRYAQASH